MKELRNKLFPADDYHEMLDCNVDIAVGQPDHMKMDELMFRTKLRTQENRCVQEVNRSKVEGLIRTKAEGLVGPGAIDIGEMPVKDEVAHAREFLEANYLFFGTVGSTLALDAESNHVFILQRMWIRPREEKAVPTHIAAFM